MAAPCSQMSDAAPWQASAVIRASGGAGKEVGVAGALTFTAICPVLARLMRNPTMVPSARDRTCDLRLVGPPLYR